MLFFNSKSAEQILLDGSSLSEVSGQSKNAQKLFQLLDTSSKVETDRACKGSWAGDPVFLIDRQTCLDLVLPEEWTRPETPATMQEIICKYAKNITQVF